MTWDTRTDILFVAMSIGGWVCRIEITIVTFAVLTALGLEIEFENAELEESPIFLIFFHIFCNLHSVAHFLVNRSACGPQFIYSVLD